MAGRQYEAYKGMVRLLATYMDISVAMPCPAFRSDCGKPILAHHDYAILAQLACAHAKHTGLCKQLQSICIHCKGPGLCLHACDSHLEQRLELGPLVVMQDCGDRLAHHHHPVIAQLADLCMPRHAGTCMQPQSAHSHCRTPGVCLRACLGSSIR